MGLSKKTLWGLYPHIQRFGLGTLPAATTATKTKVSAMINAIVDAFDNTNLKTHRDFYWLRQIVSISTAAGDTDTVHQTAINKIISMLTRQKKYSQGAAKQGIMWRGISIPSAVTGASTADNSTGVNLLRTISINKFKIAE